MRWTDQPEIDSAFPDLQALSLPACREHTAKLRDAPAVALPCAISGGVMQALGPRFRLALIVPFLRAELFSG